MELLVNTRKIILNGNEVPKLKFVLVQLRRKFMYMTEIKVPYFVNHNLILQVTPVLY